MRVLVCGINYAPDLIGVAKYNTEMCEGLAAQGHEVRVVTAPPYYPAWHVPADYRGFRYRDETRAGIPLTRTPIYVPGVPSVAKRLLHHASFAATSAPALLNAARRWRPETILSIAPSLMSSAMAARAARWFGAVSWLHIQDFEVDAALELGILTNAKLRGAMFAVERHILRSFDRVSTISPQMMRGLERKGVASNRTRELRNWIDTHDITPGDRMTALRSELGFAASDVVVLYSGNMSSKQGLELIVDAARELNQHAGNIRFVLCGEGPQKSALEEMAHGLGNTCFLGLQPADKFAQLLNTADVHVIPQRAEAADLVLPSKLGGILASGRPVVAMAASGTGLANEVDGAGLAVKPGNAAELKAALLTLSRDTGLRATLGAAARQRAEQRWDRSAILKNLGQELADARAEKTGSV